MDPEDPLAEQNIRDRYYGTNDPVAEKLMKKASDMPKLEKPEDPLITTLYVGGFTEGQGLKSITEGDLRNYFYQVRRFFSRRSPRRRNSHLQIFSLAKFAPSTWPKRETAPSSSLRRDRRPNSPRKNLSTSSSSRARDCP